MPMLGFVCFFCYIRYACAWICLLLLRLLYLCLGLSASSAASAIPMPGFVRFFCCIRCACALVRPLFLLRLLCLCLGSVICFHHCKLLRITWSIIHGKLTNLRQLETVFLSLCLLCLCLGLSAFSTTSAVPVPGFVYFFCCIRCAYAWVHLLLLLRPPCLCLGSTAFTIVSYLESPDLSLTENWQI